MELSQSVAHDLAGAVSRAKFSPDVVRDAVWAAEAAFELHRGVHTCQNSRRVSGVYGGPDRPPCATLVAIADALGASGEREQPVRTRSDVERLGEPGLLADVALYGRIVLEDEPDTRRAVEAWATTKGVKIEWR